MTTFYDEEMIAMVQVVLKYLQTERGQQALRESAARCKETADLLAKGRDIPWEKLHEPFTI